MNECTVWSAQWGKQVQFKLRLNNASEAKGINRLNFIETGAKDDDLFQLACSALLATLFIHSLALALTFQSESIYFPNSTLIPFMGSSRWGPPWRAVTASIQTFLKWFY